MEPITLVARLRSNSTPHTDARGRAAIQNVRHFRRTMDTQAPEKLGHLVGRWVACLLLVAIAAYQAYLGMQVWKLNDLFAIVGDTPNMLIMFLVWTQPLLWLFLLTTIVLAFDLLRRPRLLVVNSVATVLAVALGTAFLHLLVMLSAYASIFDLGKAS